MIGNMKSSVTSRSRGPAILVIDDDPNNLALLAEHLDDYGFTVLVAEDGESGVERALYALPDLILLDVLMPGIDGFEACLRLKADERTRGIPVIFMTGRADTDSKVRGFRVGGVDYVTKPIEMEEMLARVRTHITLSRMNEQFKAQNARLQQEVAERMRAEDELNKHREHLEDLIAERTAEVTRANEQLRDAHIRLERTLKFTEGLLSAIPTPVFYKDAQCRYLGCNRAFTETMGVSSEQIIGKTVHEVWPSEQAEVYYRKDLELMQNPASQVYEIKVRDKDGRIRNVIYARNCFRDENDQVAGIVGAFTDITERKIMEEALKKSAEKIKLFAYSVSHDLKSPAVGIYGLTQLLHRHYSDIMDDRGRNYCTQILRTAEQIASLVEKINLYVIAKEAPLNIERLNVKKILQMVKDELSTRFNVRRIEWLEPESMPEIKADRLGILRILRNLVDNALKYGGDSLSRIRFGYGQSDKYYILSVNDNGVGIRKESVEQIFKPFHRDAATKGVEGTGLGLAIVKEIADQHGGDVWVESEPGKGTTFYVSIPENL